MYVRAGQIKGCALKGWCFWIVMLEKTLESPLNSKEIKLVNPKGNQPWIFIGRTDSEAEAPILWPPDAKSLLIGKHPDAGKDGEKGWQRMRRLDGINRLNGHEFKQTPGDGEGQENLECCSPWGCKESDTTEQLNSFIKIKKKRNAIRLKTHKYLLQQMK